MGRKAWAPNAQALSQGASHPRGGGWLELGSHLSCQPSPPDRPPVPTQEGERESKIGMEFPADNHTLLHCSLPQQSRYSPSGLRGSLAEGARPRGHSCRSPSTLPSEGMESLWPGSDSAPNSPLSQGGLRLAGGQAWGSGWVAGLPN